VYLERKCRKLTIACLGILVLDYESQFQKCPRYLPGCSFDASFANLLWRPLAGGLPVGLLPSSSISATVPAGNLVTLHMLKVLLENPQDVGFLSIKSVYSRQCIDLVHLAATILLRSCSIATRVSALLARVIIESCSAEAVVLLHEALRHLDDGEVIPILA